MLIKRQLRRLIIIIFAVIFVVTVFVYSDTRAQIVSQLYYRNLSKRYVDLLTQAAARVEVYVQQSLSAVEKFAFSPELDAIDDFSALDITVVNDAVSRFALSFPEIAYIRIFDGIFSQLLFSNNADDVTSVTADSIQLKAIDQLMQDDAYVSQLVDLIADQDSAVALLLDSADNTIVYSVPIPPSSSSLGKFIVVYSVPSEMERILGREQLLDAQEKIVILKDGILLNALRLINYESIVKGGLVNSAQLVFDNRFEYINLQTPGVFGTYYYLVPATRFQLSNGLRIAIYAILLATLLLFALLIIRVAQDDKTIVRERMRLFQLRLLRILRKNDSLGEQQLNMFISSEKERVYHKVVNGLRGDPDIQQYFERQWVNLLTALRIAGVLSVPPHPNLPHAHADYAPSQHASPVRAQEAVEQEGDVVASLPAQEKVAAEDLLEGLGDAPTAEIADTAMLEINDLSDSEVLLGTPASDSGEGLEAGNLPTSMDDLAEYLDEPVEEIVAAEEQMGNLIADINPPSEPDAREKRVGVVFKEDIAIPPSVHLPEAEEESVVDDYDGLFAHARRLKYDAIIARQSGMYAINPNLHPHTKADEELRQLIDAIS